MSGDRIHVFGDHDEATIQQIERCVAAEEGARGVLCADGHLGYSQPIGGAVAYREHVSPSGVGFDIGCIAAGAPVTSPDGWHAPIERIRSDAAILCWDGEGQRRVDPNHGAVARPEATVVDLRLVDRTLTATPDHEVRTKLGWRRVDALRPGDAVACAPFVGLPFLPATGEIEATLPIHAGRRRPRDRAEALAERGLWPVDVGDVRFPALLRLLAYTAGDGTLHRDGRVVALYSSVLEDAIELRDDLRLLGFDAVLDVRERGPRVATQYVLRVHSVALHDLLSALGCPVGRKVDAWPSQPMPWLFALPAWMRAHFLSAFASAEATTPSTATGRVANLAIKQSGTTRHAIDFVADLLGSLGFRVGISASGPRVAGVQSWVAQVLGGEAEQLRFFREVGFCRAIVKRRAAAAALSVALQRRREVERRAEAIAEAQEQRAAGGMTVDALVAAVSARRRVPPALVRHGLRGRGAPRVPKGFACDADFSNEVAWLEVRDITPAGRAPVYDIVTGDAAHSFLANGIVVHNCGNKAARTDLRADDLRADLPRVMDQIVRRVEFGVGRANRRRVDHPVLDEIRQAEFAPQRTLYDLAAQQLGTVGAGNHYVDLFEDEEGVVWIGVHFGSRGFGHRTASGFLALSQGLRFGDRAQEGSMHAPPTLMHHRSALGQDYLAAMRLAARYAYAGRDVVVDEVLDILGASAIDTIHNNHNELWQERHGGEDFYVVRKGCTPAFPGQRGFVGASMGEPAVILEGVESPASAASLYSTVHGAGRAMSRTQAAGKLRKRRVNGRSVRVREGGAVDWPAVRRDLRRRGIELRGGAADEAPQAYKRLDEVLRHHEGTVRIVHTLTPIGVAMAGADTHDPYKD